MKQNWQNEERYIVTKPINKSTFDYGIPIPIKNQDKFLDNIENKTIELGKGNNIKLILADYEVKCAARNINKKDVNSRIIQIRYDGNSEFKKYLKQKFEYTYNLLQIKDKVDTDEYIEIYKGEEINTFHIKCHTHIKINEEAEQFINTIKTTSMSKSYKIPLFWAFYNKGDIKLKINEDDIYNSFKDFYNKEENAMDLQGQKNTQDYKTWDKNEYIKLAKNGPIKYLSEGTKEYFYKENELFCISDKMQEYVNNLEFKQKFRIAIESLEDKYFKRNINADPKMYDIVSDENYMEINEIVDRLQKYIGYKGYTYTDEQLSNLFLSLKTKPFVILAGISGTGKSKIVRLFAEAIGATIENKQFNMISVRPDWNDGTELMGYKNLNDDFIDGSLTKIMKEASKSENKNKPYFVCLDEMNLARVEYYLSDYLSIIESRKKVGQYIITDSELQIPDNIYLIGTVNMDDTTFTFSRKVLDRANTIEFSDVNLENLFQEITEEEITPIKVDNRFLKTIYLKTMDIEEEHREYAKEINKKIIEINNILKQSQKQFAYRVRDEIVFYMIENKKSELLNEDVAFDYQIMQKILPAITGSEQSIAQVLIDLFNFACEGKVIDDIDIEEAQKHIESAKYKMSAEKIVYMLKGYQNDGYISYWY
ncbi:MAG: AAA family ATPase [Romboutsia sp.]